MPWKIHISFLYVSKYARMFQTEYEITDTSNTINNEVVSMLMYNLNAKLNLQGLVLTQCDCKI
jgi:hypothetical protein